MPFPEIGIEQAEERVQPGSCGQDRIGVTVKQILSHGDSGSQTRDLLDFCLSQTLTPATVQIDIQKTAMGFVIEGIENQRGLTRTRHTGDHGQPIAELNIDVLQVVFAGTANAYLHKASMIQ